MHMQDQNKQVTVKNLGVLHYEEAWSMQELLLNDTIAIKLKNRKLAATYQQPTPNYLLFCEHPHVYTIGKRGNKSHLLASRAMLYNQGATFYTTNHGGDITYHVPGQLVVYPVLDLANFFTDIHRYLRSLEEAVIATLNDFGILGGRIPGLTGIWLDHQDQKRARKICALGIRSSHWVTMHGLALNINTDLHYFTQIVPCGIADKGVTSMAATLGKSQDVQAVTKCLEQHIVRLFGMSLQEN